MTARQLGFWSASIIGWVGIAYFVALAVGMAMHGLSDPIGDPILALMEVLTLVSALPMILLMAALHDVAAAERKVFGVVALSFGILFAGTTSLVHFLELTATRQLGTSGIVWPSKAYAAELLAWDVFLGLALFFSSLVFANDKSARSAANALRLTGVLCVLGTVGPVIGNMRLQFVGVFGYAVVLPFAAFQLAAWFGSSEAPERPA